MKALILVLLTIGLLSCSFGKYALTGGSVIVDEESVAVSTDVKVGDKEVTVTVESTLPE